MKEASKYSRPWRNVKYTPSKIVTSNPWRHWSKLFSISPWWAHVIVTPEANKILVFRRGTWNGLKPWIPTGGQIAPTSILGDKLLWKNAQKNEIKKNTSEIIKRIIPHRNPKLTLREWSPCRVPSRVISRHHWKETIQALNRPKKNKEGSNVWNHFTNPVVIEKAAKALARGQGLTLTKWNGWFNLFIILLHRELLGWRIHKIE